MGTPALRQEPGYLRNELPGMLYSLAPTYQAVATLHAPAGEIARQMGDYAAVTGHPAASSPAIDALPGTCEA
jgi:hypothetical protein